MWLPEAPFAEKHTVIVVAKPAAIFPHLIELDFSNSSITRLLFRLRGLPVKHMNLHGFQRLRFVILERTENEQLALGLIGRFWTVTGDLQTFQPREFEHFNKPGFAKAVWTFSLVPIDAIRTRLITETRIACTDSASEKRFRLYWWLIKPFSGLVRKEILRIIKAKAEQSIP